MSSLDHKAEMLRLSRELLDDAKYWREQGDHELALMLEASAQCGIKYAQRIKAPIVITDDDIPF